jgi:phage terminase large subunit-like protein
VDGHAYLLEDCTVCAGPKTWGTVATSAYDRHEADVVVGETNYGGAMVNFVIQTCRPKTPFKQVTASRGKHVRAEPFSSLYESGKVHHVGEFLDLEEEIVHFSTMGYTGTGSPNRADALFWALAELFPALVKPLKKAEQAEEEPEHYETGAWMG